MNNQGNENLWYPWRVFRILMEISVRDSIRQAMIYLIHNLRPMIIPQQERLFLINNLIEPQERVEIIEALIRNEDEHRAYLALGPMERLRLMYELVTPDDLVPMVIRLVRARELRQQGISDLISRLFDLLEMPLERAQELIIAHENFIRELEEQEEDIEFEPVDDDDESDEDKDSAIDTDSTQEDELDSD